MPNTLAHIGLHTLTMRPISESPYVLPIILISSVAPDSPWIWRRLVSTLQLPIDPYNLLAYATIQSSLLFSAFLAVALSMYFGDLKKCFPLAIGGCALHLFLDALQIKWGNGVILLAPFSWDLWSLGLTWPDSIISRAVTFASILAALYLIKKLPKETAPLSLVVTRRRTFIAALIFVVYVAGPVPFMKAAFESDAHYIHTLSNAQTRSGKKLQLDRKSVSATTTGWQISTPTGESLLLESDLALSPGIYSVQGVFADPDTLRPTRIHRHNFSRDLASLAGLAFCVIWFVAAAYSQRNATQKLRRLN